MDQNLPWCQLILSANPLYSQASSFPLRTAMLYQGTAAFYSWGYIWACFRYSDIYVT